MQPRTVRSLPDDYHELYFLRVTDQGNMLKMNLAAIPLAAVSIAFFIGLLLLYYVVFDAVLVIDSLPQRVPVLIGVGLVLLILPLHELIHGLALQYMGQPVTYGIKPLKGVLYATSDSQAYLWKYQYLIVLLAPLVVISIIGTLLSLFFPAEPAIWIMFATAMNATGAVGDLWMWLAVRHFPSDVLVRDEKDGMRVFGRAK